MSGQLHPIGRAVLLVLLLALLTGCNLPSMPETLTPDDTATPEPEAASTTPTSDASPAPTTETTTGSESSAPAAGGASPVPTTGGASPVPATEEATLVPTVEEPTATPTDVPSTGPTGLSVSGLVYWVHTPQAGIRVDLRACSNFATCPPLAETVTDAAGMYSFANPPVTATQVFIYYPPTGEYSATWISPPPFTVPVGGTVDTGTTHLVKDMDIISPPNEAAVDRRVLLEWEEMPSISRYRVLVFDANTDVRVVDEYTTKTSIYVSLTLGGRYYWMVWAYVSDSAPPGYSTDRVWYYLNVAP